MNKSKSLKGEKKEKAAANIKLICIFIQIILFRMRKKRGAGQLRNSCIRASSISRPRRSRRDLCRISTMGSGSGGANVWRSKRFYSNRTNLMELVTFGIFSVNRRLLEQAPRQFILFLLVSWLFCNIFSSFYHR